MRSARGPFISICFGPYRQTSRVKLKKLKKKFAWMVPMDIDFSQ